MQILSDAEIALISTVEFTGILGAFVFVRRDKAWLLVRPSDVRI
jgi:hypothetical protein